MERQKEGAEEIWAFSGWRSKPCSAGAGAGVGVIRWPDFRHARRGKWPKSQIIGATDRCPKIWIIDVQSPLNVQLPSSTDWLPICLFCKCDYHHHCQLLAKVIAECVQRRVTAGKKNPANEDPQSTMRIRGWFGKIWTIGRKMLGAGRDKGEEEHAKPFLSSDFFSLAKIKSLWASQ